MEFGLYYAHGRGRATVPSSYISPVGKFFSKMYIILLLEFPILVEFWWRRNSNFEQPLCRLSEFLAAACRRKLQLSASDVLNPRRRRSVYFLALV